MTLGERLRKVRVEKGLTLNQAADALGCAFSNYRLWEMGASIPRGDKLERIAKWTGVSAATLLKELADSASIGDTRPLITSAA